MSGSAILGVFLIVIGCLFIVAGLARVVVDIIVQARPAPPKHGFGTSDVKVWTDFLNAVGKLPPWFQSAILGVALIAAGEWIQSGHLLGQ